MKLQCQKASRVFPLLTSHFMYTHTKTIDKYKLYYIVVTYHGSHLHIAIHLSCNNFRCTVCINCSGFAIKDENTLSNIHMHTLWSWSGWCHYFIFLKWQLIQCNLRHCCCCCYCSGSSSLSSILYFFFLRWTLHNIDITTP